MKLLVQMYVAAAVNSKYKKKIYLLADSKIKIYLMYIKLSLKNFIDVSLKNFSII